MMTVDNLSPIADVVFFSVLHYRIIHLYIYIFISQISLPPSISGHYSEKIVYLQKPLSYIVNDHMQMQGHVLSRSRAPPPLNRIGGEPRNKIGICEDRQNLEMEDRNDSSTCVSSTAEGKSVCLSVCLSSCSRLIIH